MSATMTDRAAAVQAAMAEEGFAALFLSAPPNVAYVSGFRATPLERLIALVVPREGPLRLVVPSLEEEAARLATPTDARLYVWGDDEGPQAALAAALDELDGRIGIEKSHLTVARFELAAAYLTPEARLDDCTELCARLRAVKDEDELQRLRQAARIVDAAVERVAAEELRPGRSEAALAAAAARLLREEGAEALPFDPIVLAGPRAALPHGTPGATAVAKGDLVIVDLGAAFEGYCADITRTFVVGARPDARQRELHEIVSEAHLAGIRAATAGRPCAGVDRAAREVIEQAGLGPHFIHRTGHGLGLEVHEPPYLNGANEEPLAEGMVVTVEPGVYIEGYGGVRIEDDLTVRAGEPELLTQAPVALEPRG